jgi:hypothetical protein
VDFSPLRKQLRFVESQNKFVMSVKKGKKERKSE